jgi:hypothetical protein
VRVIAVAEDGDIDQVRRCRILPDLGVDAGEVDPFVESMADPFIAGVGDEVRKAADVLVVPRLQPISLDDLHGALLAAVSYEPKKKPRRVIVSLTRALIERAADRQFDEQAQRASNRRRDRYRRSETASTRCHVFRTACSAFHL